jgi:hypothetical protein
MKIAIQGHPTRGKEVIQILESLGGCNIGDYLGTRSNKYYYLDPCLNISATSVRYNFKESEIFTLEEFEKEFPFKIGDKVTIIGIPDFPKTITKMEWDRDEILYSFEGLVNRFGAEDLEKFEMKEERNITLTLEKAKEWYKKGGDLKEIALQAFTEKELNPLPRSWDEFCRKYEFSCLSIRYSNFPLKYDALFKLEQLRDCWRQGWEPIWDVSQKYCIYFSHNEIGVRMCTNASRFLTFPTREMAEEFLECFRDLIEKAGDLI